MAHDVDMSLDIMRVCAFNALRPLTLVLTSKLDFLSCRLEGASRLCSHVMPPPVEVLQRDEDRGKSTVAEAWLSE